LNQRYYSLDVFRGATVALMILVNNPGSGAHTYSPLEHAPWHGLTPTDLVFPFFLFAVGNALAFVMPRLEAAGPAVFWRKVLKRTLLIFAIGLFLNWWPFVHWQGDQLVGSGWTWTAANGTQSGVRILGVLQRIALCYFFASVLIYYTKPRGAFLISAILLLLYWALCIAGHPADPYSLAGWFGTDVDKAILHPPHMYHGEGVAFDPEGLMSTIPAITQVVFGYLVGNYIRLRSKETSVENGTNHLYQTLTHLFITAVAFLVAGYCWSLLFSVNKKIWTSSFVLVTTGLAMTVLATLIYAIEGSGTRNRITRFFDVFGKNALFVFALSAFLPRGLRLIRVPNGTDAAGALQYISPWNWWYERVCRFAPGAPEFGSLLFALTVILFMWAICYWMDKKRIYVKV
jgi:predicted acyltransferase